MELGRLVPMMMSVVAGAARPTGLSTVDGQIPPAVYVVLSLPNFGLARPRSLSLGAGNPRHRTALGMAAALMVCAIDVGVGAFLFCFLLGGDVENGVIAAGTRRRRAVWILSRCFFSLPEF